MCKPGPIVPVLPSRFWRSREGGGLRGPRHDAQTCFTLMISSCGDLVIFVSASFMSREVKISPHAPLSGHSESCVISGVTLALGHHGHF